MSKKEKIRLNDLSIRDLINPKFEKEIEKKDLSIIPISLVFIDVKKSKNKIKKISPIILSHQNDKEIKNKILHLECPESEILEKMEKILEEMGED